jgi:hypothetical protein
MPKRAATARRRLGKGARMEKRETNREEEREFRGGI